LTKSNILAGAFSLIFIGAVYLSWVIARNLTSDEGSPVRSVEGPGQILDVDLDPSCVKLQTDEGVVETICPHSTAPKVETRLIITEKPKEP